MSFLRQFVPLKLTGTRFTRDSRDNIQASKALQHVPRYQDKLKKKKKKNSEEEVEEGESKLFLL